MKYVSLALSALAIATLISCTESNEEPNQVSVLDTLTVKHSLKGYELYSWPDGNVWRYSFMGGTNRIKTLSEITGANSSASLIRVTGKDSVKLVLNKFPQGEIILFVGKVWLQNTWGGQASGDLQLPPQAVIDEVKAHAQQKGLVLNVSN